MVNNRFVPLLAAALLVGMGDQGSSTESGDKTDTLAREVVERFFRAFTAKNLDGLMKEVDVPFCREGGKNIEKRDDLEPFFQKVLQARNPSKDSIAIKWVTTLPELEKREGKFTDEERKTIEAVLGKDHRVVKVEWNRAGDGKHRRLIFVRFQKSTAKVVGII